MSSETVVLDKHGRILIPASIRKQMGWKAGERLALTVADQELSILSRRQAIQRIQEEVAKYIPAGVNLADELIQERRLEAQRDEEEYQEWLKRRVTSPVREGDDEQRCA